MAPTVSILELRWRDRTVGDRQTPRRFLDFVVDGRSLFELLGEGDATTPLVAGYAAWGADVVDELTFRRPTELEEDRQALYVCPECSDLGCGATSAVVERVGEHVVWRDFATYNPYGSYLEDPETGCTHAAVYIGRARYEAIGPFIFEAAAYEATLRAGLEAIRATPEPPRRRAPSDSGA